MLAVYAPVVPAAVALLSDVVGLADVLQTMPRSVTALPPSVTTLPLPVAVVGVMLVGMRVVTEGVPMGASSKVAAQNWALLPGAPEKGPGSSVPELLRSLVAMILSVPAGSELRSVYPVGAAQLPLPAQLIPIAIDIAALLIAVTAGGSGLALTPVPLGPAKKLSMA